VGGTFFLETAASSSALSGSVSKAVGAALFEGLETLSPSFAPFMSDRDISAGSWSPQWMKALRTSDACVGRGDLLTSLFELAKQGHELVRNPKACDVPEFLANARGMGDHSAPSSFEEDSDQS